MEHFKHTNSMAIGHAKSEFLNHDVMLSNVKRTIQFGIFLFNQLETFGPINNVARHIKIGK
jgi:hypothetical protein